MSSFDAASCQAGSLPTTRGDAGAVRYDCSTDADCAWRTIGCFSFCVNASERSDIPACASACFPNKPACTCINHTCSACYAAGPYCG